MHLREFVENLIAPNFANRLRLFNRRRTRTVTLTVDRANFEGGKEAYFKIIRNDEAINQFIHNLSRTAKIKITQYAWVIEWHKDGFPHWHLFIETNKKDWAGKIGGDTLRKHWKYGSWIKEGYIKNKGHWKQFTEYFENKGYFNPKRKGVQEQKDKTHQLELPEWARNLLNKDFKIRKWGSSKKPPSKNIDNKNPKVNGDKLQIKPNKNSKKPASPKKSKREYMTYGEVLNSCGQTTVCKIQRGPKRSEYRTYNIPYKSFLNELGDMGWYEPGEGFLIQFQTLDDYLNFEELYSEYINISQKDNPAKVPI